jgi:hypothetical protein
MPKAASYWCLISLPPKLPAPQLLSSSSIHLSSTKPQIHQTVPFPAFISSIGAFYNLTSRFKSPPHIERAGE